MKKRVLLILVLLFVPLFLNAEEVEKIDISSKDEAKINSKVEVNITIKYSNLGTYGIGGYAYQLDFDDNIFIPVGIEQKDYFDTNIYKDENNKYHVIGVANKDNKSKNKCSDNILYCSNIKDTITFIIKSTKEKKSTIKIYASNTYLFEINSDLGSENKKIIDSEKGYTKTIIIDKSKSKELKANNISKNINTKDIESIILNQLQEYKNIYDDKSNNYLKSLEIVGYDIEFDKHLLTYDLNVDKDINSLEINAVSENKNTTIEIVGNNNLKENNNVVSITITSEDKSSKTYTINVIHKEENEEQQVIETKEDIKDFIEGAKKKINNKTIKIFEIIGLSLLGIILIIILIKIISNNKLNKKIKNFDKF